MYFSEDEDYIQYRKEMYESLSNSIKIGELPNDIFLQYLSPIEEGYPCYKRIFITLPGDQNAEICFMMKKNSDLTIAAEAMVILDKEPIVQSLTTVYNNTQACDLIHCWSKRARENRFYNRKINSSI